MKLGKVERSKIGVANGGSVAAVIEEIRTSTMDELNERYGMSVSYLSALAKDLKVRCSKVCRICKEKRLAEDMNATHAGHPSNVCEACVSPLIMRSREAQRRRKEAMKTSYKAPLIDRAALSPVLAWVCRPISNQQGNWNRWAE